MREFRKSLSLYILTFDLPNVTVGANMSLPFTVGATMSLPFDQLNLVRISISVFRLFSFSFLIFFR